MKFCLMPSHSALTEHNPLRGTLTFPKQTGRTRFYATEHQCLNSLPVELWSFTLYIR